ncbi:MAG: radical SAM protein [Desulfobacterales bacterium]|nr:radical SAM protein [Desulfobacterales bacterium]
MFRLVKHILLVKRWIVVNSAFAIGFILVWVWILPSLPKVHIESEKMVGDIPLFFGQIVGGYGIIWFLTAVLVKNKPRLKYVDVAFNYLCNLSCPFCFAKVLKSHSHQKMTLDGHERFCEQAMKLGAYHFDFQGGEPLLNYEELKVLIKAYKPKRNYISVTTNGLLLTAKKIVELKKLGVDLFILSVNSESDLAKAVLLLVQGVRPVLNFIVSHYSVRTKLFVDLATFAKEEGVLVNCLWAVSVGGWRNTEEAMLNEEDKQLFYNMQKRFPLRRDLEANFGGYGCGAVKEAVYLTPWGDVYACPFIHKSLGNVKQEPLETIRERGLEIPCFSQYHPKCLVAEDREILKDASLLT